MANGAAGTAGQAVPSTSRPTTEEQLRAARRPSSGHAAEDLEQQKIFLDRLGSKIWSGMKGGASAVREKTSNVSQAAWQSTKEHTSNTVRAAPAAAQRIIVQSPGAAKGAVGAGFGAVASGYAKALESAFISHKVVKATGTFAPLLIVVAVQYYDVVAGFPRGVGSFGAILAAYITAFVLFGLVWHFDLKQMLIAIALQIFVPWLINVLMFGFFIVPLLQYRPAMLWTMVLFTPMIWLVFSSTDIEKDFIMRHARTAYVICLCFLLLPTMTNWFMATLPAGAQTTVNTERTFKDIVDQTGTNMKNYFNAFPKFIDGILTGTQQNFENEPPPGSGDGLPQKIGLATGDEDIVVRFGSTQKASMVLHAESTDHSVYKFDTYCRFTKRDDKEKDINDDGMVGLSEDTAGWTPTGDKLQFSGVRTIFCPNDPSKHDITYTDDTLTVQFGVKYAIPVVGSYTTYFIENRIENGVLVTSYNDATEFFTRNPALSPSLSKSTDAPCFMTIDNNNQLPPVGVQSDDPNFFVDVAIGYQIKDFYGTSVIDSIDSLKVQVPDGVTNFVCEADSNMFTKSVETVDGQQATFYTMSPAAGIYFHGKKLRIDCRAYVNKDSLIWSGDYSQSTFLVNSTCNIFNTKNVNVKLIGFAKTGTGGAGGSFSQWPLEGPLTTCYESRTLNGKTDWHDGIDIGVGGTVKASAAGTVDRVCRGTEGKEGKNCPDNPGDPATQGYGNVVIIKHSEGFYTFYAHLADINSNIAPGKPVTAGEELGPAGHTGYSVGSGGGDGTHLHFGITNKDGKLTNSGGPEPGRNPLCYLPNNQYKSGCDAPTDCPVVATGGTSGQEREVVNAFAAQLGIPENDAWALAMIEGSGKHWDGAAIKTGDGGDSIGMMQINLPSHPGCRGTISGSSCGDAPECAGKTIEDLTCNVAVGLRKFKSEQGVTCQGLSGYEAAALHYAGEGCCGEGSCSSRLASYRNNGGTV